LVHTVFHQAFRVFTELFTDFKRTSKTKLHGSPGEMNDV